MLISLCPNELGLPITIRGSEILWKWLWLEYWVTDCDSKRDILWKTWLESILFTIFLNVTRVESESPKIVTRVESRYHCCMHNSVEHDPVSGSWSNRIRIGQDSEKTQPDQMWISKLRWSLQPNA